MKKYILISLFSLMVFGCGKDFLNTNPTTSLKEEYLMSSLSGCQTLLDGIHRHTYRFGSNHDEFGQKSVDHTLDRMGDDCFPTERGYGWYVGQYQFTTTRNITASWLYYCWGYYYDIINNSNLLITNLEALEVDDALMNRKRNLLAQAYTYRAHSHFYLVQLFAKRFEPGGQNGHLGVPLSLVPNPGAQERSSVQALYAQINSDLDLAIKYFGEGGRNISRPNASHINYNTTLAIKANVALTQGNWAVARDNAALAKTGYALASDYSYGWNKVGSEWFWGAVLIDEQQTSYASFFSHIDPYFGGYASLGNHSKVSIELYDFMDDSDLRKQLFTTVQGKTRIGYKFSGWGEWTNDYLYMKAGEMYLVEAEARCRLGDEDGAKNLLDLLIRSRTEDGGNPYPLESLSGANLLDHILMQRRADLWGEGRRFLDLKRLNIDLDRSSHEFETDQLLPATKLIPAGDVRWQFLIPDQEMRTNPFMVQNEQ